MPAAGVQPSDFQRARSSSRISLRSLGSAQGVKCWMIWLRDKPDDRSERTCALSVLKLRSRWPLGPGFQIVLMVGSLALGVLSRTAGCLAGALDGLTALLGDDGVEWMVDVPPWLAVGHEPDRDDLLRGDEMGAAVCPGDEDRGVDGADGQFRHGLRTSAEVDADLLADYPGADGHQVARGDFDWSAHIRPTFLLRQRTLGDIRVASPECVPGSTTHPLLSSTPACAAACISGGRTWWVEVLGETMGVGIVRPSDAWGVIRPTGKEATKFQGKCQGEN